MCPISAPERLSRFLFSRNHFSPEKSSVKYGAFLPDARGKTSVFRTSTLNNEQIWDIGLNHVASASGRSLRGRGDIHASHALDEGLILQEATPGDHPLHANIDGWPTDRGKRQLIAIKLAEKAQLFLLSNPAEASDLRERP